MIDYDVGDVIEGKFSCSRFGEHLRVIVRGKVPNSDGRSRGGFNADRLDYLPRTGYGAWGFDDEVEKARPGTPDDEAAAAAVKDQVERDTDAYIAKLRARV